MNYEELIKQAEQHFNRREHSQTIIYATQAIESDPNRIDGYYWRGSTYSRIKAQDDMKKDADSILDCLPSTALHFAYRGWAYNVKKNHEQEAIDECIKAITKDASIKEAYYFRACAYDDLKEFDRAIDDCNEAIRLDSEYAAAYNCRGVIYAKKGDLDQAISNYDIAIKLDPKFDLVRNNRVNAYHAKDDNLAMPLIKIRENVDYMNDLKKNIKQVVPFLGAGTSIPYGYYTWEKLLRILLDKCRHIYKDKDEVFSELNYIEKDIENREYVDAASRIDGILANIKSTVCTVIRRIAKANPIKLVPMRSILSEYLHLFPNKIILTTNYDTVVEEILKLHGKSVESEVPALESNEKRDFKWQIEVEKVLYHLHGVYTKPDSITLSKPHYDDYYGIEGEIKSNLRRKLSFKIHQI